MDNVKKLPGIKLAERLVGEGIIQNVGTLMWELKEIEGFESSEWYEDWLSLQLAPPDHEEAATESGWIAVGNVMSNGVFAKKVDNPYNGRYEDSARLVGWDLASTDDRDAKDDDDPKVIYTFVREAGATFERTLKCVIELDYEDDDEAWQKLCETQDVEVYEEIDEDSTDWEELCDAQGIDADQYRSEIYEHWLVQDWFARRLRDHGELVVEFMGLTIWGRGCTGQAIALDYGIQRIAAEVYADEWNGCWYYGEPEEKKE